MNDPNTLNHLGSLLEKQGRWDDAIETYQQALTLDPAHAGALEALCRLLENLGRADEAIPFLDRATAGQPEPEWVAGCRSAWDRFERGQVDEALDLFRKAAAGTTPEPAETAIATIIPGSPQSGNQAIREARARWAERYLPPALDRRRQPSGSPLRIGYVSSFFHCDNWMKPVWGLINSHDRRNFEIHLFSEAAVSTVRHGYRPHAQDRFHDISGMPISAAAECVEQAGIDVLVDLNGYSRVQTLPLFALRPAPVVLGWFNMYATTGMRCYDCLIGDEEVISKHEEQFYCEKIVRVPGCYLTFEVGYPTPPVAAAPCLARGMFTFGCLAPQYKITAEVVRAWSRILLQAPRSSLLLRSTALASPAVREHVAGLFEACRIAPERIRLEGPAEHFAFLHTYDEIDLALDTFPYSGGTTTMEAVWQGVPVVTFRGDRWAARTSASILRAAGLGRFVGESLDDYVATAAAVANSREAWLQLGELRNSMRSKLLASPVCDTRTFARNMERIYSDLALKAMA
ncbi:MAG: tetratricopeptide repeat protein [Bryobacteraceae bacterium]